MICRHGACLVFDCSTDSDCDYFNKVLKENLSNIYIFLFQTGLEYIKQALIQMFFWEIFPIHIYIYIYIQGRHGKSGHKEFLSHTLKNKVISLIYFCITRK